MLTYCSIKKKKNSLGKTLVGLFHPLFFLNLIPFLQRFPSLCPERSSCSWDISRLFWSFLPLTWPLFQGASFEAYPISHCLPLNIYQWLFQRNTWWVYAIRPNPCPVSDGFLYAAQQYTDPPWFWVFFLIPPYHIVRLTVETHLTYDIPLSSW